MYILTDDLFFPPIERADENGLLALGGDLNPERLLLAYKSGIFPWFNEQDPICWWSPDPRFVLFPAELRISHSMQTVIRKKIFEFRVNTHFASVIANCKNATRSGQPGTWITDEMEEAYTRLHQLGYAHCAEAWCNNKLVGGLYGVRLGNLFFGESMFSLQSNASKFSFIQYVELLQKENVVLIDCQLHTEHLESLGARMIRRDQFKKFLENL
ncbi:MAG: leucyl/phenylalanyl-tRNA--protein transferase [Gloeobacteraceae cyanobacterium ES-bin-316]|nr:leucyl/phenylalanyl-tRNA--protein transferase [Ferruginibacter sp.]